MNLYEPSGQDYMSIKSTCPHELKPFEVIGLTTKDSGV